MAEIIENRYHTIDTPSKEVSLYDVESAVAKKNLDLLGDSVQVMSEQGIPTGWTLFGSHKVVNATWEVQTGRDHIFKVELEWPRGSKVWNATSEGIYVPLSP